MIGVYTTSTVFTSFGSSASSARRRDSWSDTRRQSMNLPPIYWNVLFWAAEWTDSPDIILQFQRGKNGERKSERWLALRGLRSHRVTSDLSRPFRSRGSDVTLSHDNSSVCSFTTSCRLLSPMFTQRTTRKHTHHIYYFHFCSHNHRIHWQDCTKDHLHVSRYLGGIFFGGTMP